MRVASGRARQQALFLMHPMREVLSIRDSAFAIDREVAYLIREDGCRIITQNFTAS